MVGLIRILQYMYVSGAPGKRNQCVVGHKTYCTVVVLTNLLLDLI